MPDTRAPLSVIVPTLDASEALARLSATLGEGLSAGLIRELVVSDGGSVDGTDRIARALGAELVTGPPGRGGQIARGVAASSGPWLMIVHADSALDPGWAAAVADHIDRGAERAAYFRMRFRADGLAPTLVSGWAGLRSRHLGLPYGDQGLLVSRRVLAEVGGVPHIPLMEDVALARALKGRLVGLPHGLSTSAERYLREGWLRRGARNLGTLVRYFAGADPQALADRYNR